MTGLPASCSTWILPLLLLLFVSFQPLSSFPVLSKENRHEFQKLVELFGKQVKNCPDSCDPGHRMNGSCSCFNFNVSSEECEFPVYFTKGLKSMHPNTTSLLDVPSLVKRINRVAESTSTKFTFCSSSGVYVMSPKRLSEDLKDVMQQLNTIQNIGR